MSSSSDKDQEDGCDSQQKQLVQVLLKNADFETSMENFLGDSALLLA